MQSIHEKWWNVKAQLTFGIGGGRLCPAGELFRGHGVDRQQLLALTSYLSHGGRDVVHIEHVGHQADLLFEDILGYETADFVF